MSIVTVQIGQCGNQIGYELLSTLTKEYANDCDVSRKLKYGEYNEDCMDVFFEEIPQRHQRGCKYKARSVLVDMEAKVVTKMVDDASKSAMWKYDSKSQVVHKRGSGNNWAYGFKQASQGLEQELEEVLARQAEKCDRVSGFMVMMSVAGGTGSGVGSMMTSLIKDLYPHTLLLNQVTWPFQSGEVAVQSYNATLSLANTYPHSDCLLSFHNDNLHQTCLKNTTSQDVSFRDMNQHVSKDISYLLSPASSPSSFSSKTSPDSLNDLVTNMCAHPDYKLCRVVSPHYSTDLVRHYNTYHWPAVLKELSQRLHRSNNNTDLEWLLRYNQRASSADHAYAQMLVLRGSEVHRLDVETVRKQYLKIKSAYSASNADAFACCGHARWMFNDEKAAMLVSNDLPQMQALDGLVQRAWNMFVSKAFLHQYHRFGLEETDFLDAFAFFEQLLSNYAHLSYNTGC